MPDCKVSWHLYPVLIDFKKLGKSRANFIRALQSEKIGTQVHYIPLHLQPYFSTIYGKLNLPGAIAYYEKVLSLPIFPNMELVDVERVVEALKHLLKKT